MTTITKITVPNSPGVVGAPGVPAMIQVNLVSPTASSPGGAAAGINDATPSSSTVYSSAKTEQVIDAAVAEQLYDYDQLVFANLSI